MRANSLLVWIGGIVRARRHIENCRLAVAVAWRKTVVNAWRDSQKLRVIGGKNHGLRLTRRGIEQPDFGRSADAIPAIPLQPMAMPRLDDACRRRGDVGLADSVRVIGGAEYLGQSPTLIEVGSEWSKLG